jgi:acetyl-CoA carboxylase carboxyltransferase component/biotin carboxyl carrier protein
VHLGERECSVQRRFQKVVEIAPAPGLDAGLRSAIIESAVNFAREVRYSNLGTFEFLVDVSGHAGDHPFVFIEANARLQVEHTVTEEVTGVDLVQTQIRLASGATLAELGLDEPGISNPRGSAIQVRVNMEIPRPDGSLVPGGGMITSYDPPSGPGVRTDGFGYAGYRTSGAFDSLLAKVICHSTNPSFPEVAGKAARALSEFRLEGVGNNIAFLRNILAHPDFLSGDVHTRWIDEKIAELAIGTEQPRRFVQAKSLAAPDGFVGARISSRDPLALFDHDAQVKAERPTAERAARLSELAGSDGSVGIASPIQGTVVAISCTVGDSVRQGQQLTVVMAMKMEHVIDAPHSGVVRSINITVGDVVREGYPLVFIEPTDIAGGAIFADAAFDLDGFRADLQEMFDRHAITHDENRAEAVAKRYGRGFQMPRENIAQLVDPGSFLEYWPLIVARQHQRHDLDALRRNTPADGVLAGTCSINGDLFDETRSRAILVHYDYTVLAGTQGGRGHYKQNRMFEIAHQNKLPIVLFGEGGGGRPGEDDNGPWVPGDTHTYTTFSQLSGLVPMIGIVNGRTFAGNAVLVACCDVIIATESSNFGVGGPAMIEGGGLGIYTPEEVGPMSVQVPNGVVDVLVANEAEAVSAAKKYLSYFQGPITTWEECDQRRLRHVIPENRLRLYDMRDIIDTIADKGSVLELRAKFGIGVITAFIRVEGRPMGVIANNPHHLSGAIDADGAGKGARFLQLCDAFDIPVLSLIDCPGIMVGPDAESTALVRHCARMFNVGANMTTPLFGVVVRKAYGLGVQAMCGASTMFGFFTIGWPTAEFAGMNIEGAVKLGYRKELAAIADPQARRQEFDRRVQEAYETARGVNAGTGGGIDDIIDPADTRGWIASSLKRLPPVAIRTAKKYPHIDPW